MYKKIVLATDGSEHSVRAGEHAVHMAKANPGTHIDILYIIDNNTSVTGIHSHFDVARLEEDHKELIAPLEKLAQEAGVHYNVIVIQGEPAPSIVEYANHNDVDLVFIGSRGMNAFQEFVLGSVSHKVAKTVKCPVMIIK